MNLEYHFADMNDLDYLVRMRIRDLKMFSSCEMGEDIKASIGRFYESKMRENGCFTLLGCAGKEVAATATLYYYDVLPSNENPKGRVGQITNVWVDEPFRGQGIATQMVEMLMEKARHEAGMICLNSSKGAYSMYKRMGFEANGNYLVYYFDGEGV